MNKKKNGTIIKLNDSQVKKIDNDFKKINDSKIFDKKSLRKNKKVMEHFHFYYQH